MEEGKKKSKPDNEISNTTKVDNHTSDGEFLVVRGDQIVSMGDHTGLLLSQPSVSE